MARPADVARAEALDPRRVRSFAGLIAGRLGYQADTAVSHTFLTLIVAARTSSLFMVTFALTAHRLVSWLAYPLVGRLSDRTDTTAGRRAPYMAGGLLVLAACTALYPMVNGYWLLVAVIAVARQARVAYSLPEFTSIPEIFGRSRWVRALVAVGVGGFFVGLFIRGTVVATWKDRDPSTWRPAFFLAAALVGLAGVLVLLLVREAPAARQAARSEPDAPLRERLGDFLAVPSAKTLVAALLLGSAASGATSRAFPVYAEHVLGATGKSLAVFGILTVPLGALISIPIGYVMATRLRRRQMIVLAPLLAAGGAAAHIVLNRLWQSFVVTSLLGAVLVAFALAIAPFALRMLPRTGSMGERFGLFVGPTSFVAVVASYASSLTYDHVVHDYRVIWVYPTLLMVTCALVLSRLHVPKGRERIDPEGLFDQMRKSFATTGSRRLFAGEVTEEDVDPMAFFESAHRLGTRVLEGGPEGAPGADEMARLLSTLSATVDGSVVEGVLEHLDEGVVLRAGGHAYEGKEAVMARLSDAALVVTPEGVAYGDNGRVTRIDAE